MRITTSTRVVAYDGTDIGDIKRMVIDPHTKEMMYLVVQTGSQPGGEKIYPAGLIESQQGDQIRLRPFPEEYSGPQDFRENDYVMVDEHEFVTGGDVDEQPVPSYYFYPAFPALGSRNLSGETPQVGEGPPVQDRSYNEVEQQNIPQGTIALKEGSKVYSHDNKVIGTLDQVLIPTGSHKVSHFVISKGLLLKERKLIPVDWIKDLTQEGVYLSMTASTISGLPPYQEKEK